MLQLEYFLGSVSMNLGTFLGFSSVLSFSPSNGDTNLTCILDGSIGRVQASHLKVPGSNPALNQTLFKDIY